MTFDPSKLSADLWYECCCKQCCGTDNDRFICLAQNAFAVMMQRGWYATGHERDGDSFKTWIVVNSFCVALERSGNTGTYFIANDPFTALVEADRWYRETLSAKESHFND